jgi:MtN3 and saliva related transmembrane protein
MNLSEIVGYIATAFTVLAFIPQVWQVLKTRKTKDISLATFLFLLAGAMAWFTYGILLNSAPIIITNSIIGVFQSIIIGFKLKYG